MSTVSIHNTEHYQWGEPNAKGQRCDGWHLVKTPTLNIIQERVPQGCAEVKHYHQHAEQFFFVLEGIATIELENQLYELSPLQGLHVPAGKAHLLRNDQEQDLIFTVTSTPPSHGDKILV
ncbi:cupin domain-containing protein [Paraneptunicella aestuarii]|uniref:cupin domain-containing protein n=1 Tax=Paraneptunicella aestuarii TaxID=2831148 RepID=UPI001E3F772E|nr:cupin domain-containing protein [Paraneptunicella aestuarii]UAA39951.1 cupin domain-containing protein [Paraneptunicella aestuarii]